MNELPKKNLSEVVYYLATRLKELLEDNKRFKERVEEDHKLLDEKFDDRFRDLEKEFRNFEKEYSERKGRLAVIAVMASMAGATLVKILFEKMF
jgi:chromosome segregation ATPase